MFTARKEESAQSWSNSVNSSVHSVQQNCQLSGVSDCLRYLFLLSDVRHPRLSSPNYCSSHPTTSWHTQHPNTAQNTQLLLITPKYCSSHLITVHHTQILLGTPHYCSSHPNTAWHTQHPITVQLTQLLLITQNYCSSHPNSARRSQHPITAQLTQYKGGRLATYFRAWL